MEHVLGIDIGGSGVKGAPVNVTTGTKLAPRYKIETPKPLTPKEMVGAIQELIDNFDWKGPVGVGFPTRLKGSVATQHGNLHPDWQGMDLKAYFEKKLNHSFEVLNDADAAGIAEMDFGAGKNNKGLVILCTFGTGIGSAMFYNHRLIANSELGQLEYKGDKFEKYAADSARKREELTYLKWGKRVNKFLKHVEYLFSPELIIIGGGSSKRLALFEEKIKIETPYTAAEMLNVAGTVGAALGYVRKVKRRAEGFDQ